MIDRRRVFAEKRTLILPLAIAAAINLVVYAFVIYPQTSSAEGLEARARAAAQSRARAQADLKSAEAVHTGQERAVEQLAKFYESILPKGQDGARRITYRRLAVLADEANLDYDRRTINISEDQRSDLRRMEVVMSLSGDYSDVRRFIHRLETAPEFVVIENIALAQGERGQPLTLTVKMATYFKAGA
jgi:Tfp pilus assembly protein PilO